MPHMRYHPHCMTARESQDSEESSSSCVSTTSDGSASSITGSGDSVCRPISTPCFPVLCNGFLLQDSETNGLLPTPPVHMMHPSIINPRPYNHVALAQPTYYKQQRRPYNPGNTFGMYLGYPV
jgi:hypothetical protein